MNLLQLTPARFVFLFLFSIFTLSSQAQTWTGVANDPANDGSTPGWLDGQALSYYYDSAADSIWFKLDVFNLNPNSSAWGINVQLSIPGVSPSGNWWGTQNSSFSYNKLVTAWVTGTAPSNYSGTIGIANLAGVGSGNYDNLASNNMTITADVPNNTILVGMPRTDVVTNSEMGGNSSITVGIAGSVGSNVGWNDDIFSSSASLTITIPGGGGLTAPLQTAPANNATNQDTLGVLLAWGSAATATSYTVEYSTDNTFMSGIISNTTTSLGQNITGLAAGTTYYWHVNASDGSTTTSWSSIWSFTTVPAGALPVTMPNLLTPMDQATEQSTDLNFMWNPVFGATQYQIQIGTDTFFTVANEMISATSYTGANLAQQTNYVWRVRSMNAVNTSAWSPTWRFRTAEFTVGLQKLPETSHLFISIYPNPATHNVRFKLNLTDSAPVEIRINDLAGREVYIQKFNQLGAGSQIIQVPVDALDSGWYITTVSIDNEAAVSRRFFRL